MGIPQVKKKLLRSGRRCMDITKINLKGKGWYEVKCINLAQDGDKWPALVNTRMNYSFEWNSRHLLSSEGALYTTDLVIRLSHYDLFSVSWIKLFHSLFLKILFNIIVLSTPRSPKQLFQIYELNNVGSSILTFWSRNFTFKF